MSLTPIADVNVIPLFKQVVSNIYLFKLHEHPDHGSYLDVLNPSYNRTQISLVLSACNDVELSAEFKNLPEKSMAACALAIQKAQYAVSRGYHEYTPIAEGFDKILVKSSDSLAFIKDYRKRFFNLQNEIDAVLHASLLEYINSTKRVQTIRSSPTALDMAETLRDTTAGAILLFVDDFNALLANSYCLGVDYKSNQVLDKWTFNGLSDIVFEQVKKFLTFCGLVREVSLNYSYQPTETYKILKPTMIGKVVIGLLRDYERVDSVTRKGDEDYRNELEAISAKIFSAPHVHSLFKQLGSYDVVFQNWEETFSPKPLDNKYRELLIAHELVMTNPLYVPHTDDHDIILTKKGRDVYSIHHFPLYMYKVTSKEELEDRIMGVPSDLTTHMVDVIVCPFIECDEFSQLYQLALHGPIEPDEVRSRVAVNKLVERGFAKRGTTDSWLRITEDGLEFFKHSKFSDGMGYQLLPTDVAPIKPRAKVEVNFEEDDESLRKKPSKRKRKPKPPVSTNNSNYKD